MNLFSEIPVMPQLSFDVTEIGQLTAELWLKTICNRAAVRHLEFEGYNNGFFEKLIRKFLRVINRDHSSKLLSF